MAIGHQVLFPNEIKLDAEIEIEHAGTGSSLVSYDEKGKYKSELDKGGVVNLEELFIERGVSKDLLLKVGLIKVVVGQTCQYDRPVDYLSTTRPESEENIIPVGWTEMGAQLAWKSDTFNFMAQIINGLDSSGFSSETWIADGQQSKFVGKKASDLAAAFRADFNYENLIIGLSTYYGSTSRNRPHEDLAKSCEKQENKVAPCGYITGNVLLTDLHFRLDSKIIFSQGLVLLGSLENSEKISQANSKLSETLDASNDSVAKKAYVSWFELGYKFDATSDAGYWNAYSRIQKYDSMYQVEGSIKDEAQYDRRVISLGTGYNLNNFYLAKFEVSQRQFGLQSFNKENFFIISNAIVF